ncbi:TetR/AcrR family transcriptional regulator [Nocardiopsis suaedae]|uniref:TetR/AcrR family transcriptional regulator C-terminal ligand-binding domain-containing protein n=1 Tax=Nocardiopsis suaedae TaxID=3018444 RepID=A0ABT4TM49_9ACTN|nr:TetR/AcrR family transcriptional regulator [Nocardiopsis suaedae]MDA2805772.1 TetR/AcrR family transcriptional regulator C-terminal ligand-binding domain-containing protein [Nocardiopsis suaedae]
MGETHAPGTVRPGGRTARTRAAALRAAADILVEKGFAGLDLAEVAGRAKVGRTTVYRRWGSAAGLVVDLLADLPVPPLPDEAADTFEGDLRANALTVRERLADARQGPLFKAVVAAATCDARAAEALRRFHRVRVAEWGPCVTRAAERGEVPHGTDPGEVALAVSAPLYQRLLAGLGPVDEAAADRSARAAAAAARAGAYVR